MKTIEMNKEIDKDIIIAIIISVVHFIASYIYDKFYFGNYELNIMTILMNILFFIIVNIVWYKIIKIIKNRKKYKNKIILFTIYLIISLVVLALIFPGSWCVDEYNILKTTHKFEILGWHHLFTSIFYIQALKFIPVPVGVVIIQNIIISCIVAYIVDEIVKTKDKRKPFYILLTGAFLLPPLLLHNLKAHRTILYAYVMLLTLYLTIKYYKQNTKLSRLQLIKLTLLYLTISSLRSEGIYNILIYIIVSIVFAKKQMETKTFAIISTIILIIMVISVKKINLKCGGENKAYNIIATIEQIAPLTVKANEENNEEALEKLGKVLDIDIILENKNKKGVELSYTTNVIKDTYTEKEYKEYLKTYIKLIMQYPNVFIKERVKEYLDTNALIQNMENRQISIPCWSDVKTMYVIALHNTKLKGSFLINIKLRQIVMNRFAGLDEEGNVVANPILYSLIWNVFIPTVAILITAIILLSKKKIFEAIIIGSVLIKTGIVFLTAPDSFFMYYLAEYIIGNLLLAYFIAKGISKIKIKEVKE